MDISKLTPFEKLDLVLRYLNKIPFPGFQYVTEIRDGLKQQGVDFGKSVMPLLMILNKLEDDKNVRKELNQDGITKYYPTFEGEFFILKGGYVQKEVDRLAEIAELQNLRTLETRLKEKAVEQNRQLIFAGSFAAVFSGGILVLELVKYYDQPEVGHLELILWVGIIILGILLRIAIPKIFP